MKVVLSIASNKRRIGHRRFGLVAVEATEDFSGIATPPGRNRYWRDLTEQQRATLSYPYPAAPGEAAGNRDGLGNV